MSYQYKNFSDLDFEDIKSSLVSYLETQPGFQGFDFKGTAINALINLLAYNTQYNGFYLNMHASERFLSTAQRRENVVALAKNLGYQPSSATGAFAEIEVIISVSAKDYAQDVLTIPKNFLLKAATEEETFTLYNKTAKSIPMVSSNDVEKVFRGKIEVFEGKKFEENFTFKESDKGVTLSNKDVQADKLLVYIRNGSLEEEWSPAFDIDPSNFNKKVYYTEEVIGQKTRIYFGDNIVGEKPAIGSTIRVEYYTTKGSLANGASDITIADTVPYGLGYTVVNPDDILTGGSEAESMDSIRVKAPVMFEALGRAVTAGDYKNILTKKVVPNAHTTASWGGEDETPMKLGYVFLSWVTSEEFAKLNSGIKIYRSPTEKGIVEKTIREKYATTTIFPEVVDPRIVYIMVSTKVYYDSTKNVYQQELIDAVKTSIKTYYNQNCSQFQSTLRYSKLSTSIDSCSPFITSNDLTISLYQQIENVADLSLGISFGVPLKEYTLRSTEFIYNSLGTEYENCFFSDKPSLDGSSSQTNEVFLWKRDSFSGVETKVFSNRVGVVDRILGEVVFEDSFQISGIVGISPENRLKIYASPSSRDVDFKKNLLGVLQESDIDVDVMVD